MQFRALKTDKLPVRAMLTTEQHIPGAGPSGTSGYRSVKHGDYQLLRVLWDRDSEGDYDLYQRLVALLLLKLDHLLANGERDRALALRKAFLDAWHYGCSWKTRLEPRWLSRERYDQMVTILAREEA